MTIWLKLYFYLTIPQYADSDLKTEKVSFKANQMSVCKILTLIINYVYHHLKDNLSVKCVWSELYEKKYNNIRLNLKFKEKTDRVERKEREKEIL